MKMMMIIIMIKWPPCACCWVQGSRRLGQSFEIESLSLLHLRGDAAQDGGRHVQQPIWVLILTMILVSSSSSSSSSSSGSSNKLEIESLSFGKLASSSRLNFGKLTVGIGVYIYIYICIYVCVYICIYMYIYIYIYVYTGVPARSRGRWAGGLRSMATPMWKTVLESLGVCVYIYIYIYTNICVYVHIYIYIYIHIHICIYTYLVCCSIASCHRLAVPSSLESVNFHAYCLLLVCLVYISYTACMFYVIVMFQSMSNWHEHSAFRRYLTWAELKREARFDAKDVSFRTQSAQNIDNLRPPHPLSLRVLHKEGVIRSLCEPCITDGIGNPDPNPRNLVNWCV